MPTLVNTNNGHQKNIRNDGKKWGRGKVYSLNQNGYQKPQIEEGQTMQWPKVKGQKDKQRSRKHYTEN